MEVPAEARRLADILNNLPQHLGEDSDFQEIDELTDALWCILFDALKIPNGRVRTDIVHEVFAHEGDNLDWAYKTGSNFYDTYYDTEEVNR